jgi:predicted nuclease of predicted toxin-antitoxin system
VTYVAEFEPGLDDVDVLAEAYRQEAILLACDGDFGALVFENRLPSGPVVFLRQGGLSLKGVIELGVEVLSDESRIGGYFTTVRAGSVRQRKLPS